MTVNSRNCISKPSPANAMKTHLRTFYILTISQVFSIVGSAMTNVAIGIRVFNDTGDSTPLMLASFFSALPLMIGGSFAGVFADRWNRRSAVPNGT